MSLKISFFRVFCLCIFFLVSCSPKAIITQKVDQQYGMNTNGYFAFFELDDTTSFDQSYCIGEFKIKDQGLTVNCSYEDVKKLSIEQARKMGGNAIKIIEHKNPNIYSTCHRIKAKVYRVEDAWRFEKFISWNAERKLMVRDFKGTIINRPALAATYSYFDIHPEWHSFNRMAIYVNTVFSCDNSYFKPSDYDSLTLNHEQLHFDITELYARKLTKKFIEETTDYTSFLNQYDKIRKELFDSLVLKQDEYDSEVYSDRSKQKDWQLWVEKELNNYQNYKEKSFIKPINASR